MALTDHFPEPDTDGYTRLPLTLDVAFNENIRATITPAELTDLYVDLARRMCAQRFGGDV